MNALGRIFRSIACSMFLLGLMAPLGNAAITTYTTEDSWLTAVGGTSFLEDFNDATLHPSIISITGGSENTFPFAGTSAFVGQQVFRGQTTEFDAITFSFSTALFGLGGFWDLAGPGGPGANLTLNLIGGGVEVFTDYFANSLAGTFQGFTTTSAFSSMVLSNGTVSGAIETFELENMRVAAIPEPEIYAMLAAGLGMMGFIARRRKQQLAAA